MRQLSPKLGIHTQNSCLTMGNSLLFCPSQPLGKSREKGHPERGWPLVNLPFSVDGVLPTALGRHRKGLGETDMSHRPTQGTVFSLVFALGQEKAIISSAQTHHRLSTVKTIPTTKCVTSGHEAIGSDMWHLVSFLTTLCGLLHGPPSHTHAFLKGRQCMISLEDKGDT